MRYFWLLLYYGFARYLPASHFFIGGKLYKALRNTCGRHLFKTCGTRINIERMAFFGDGREVELGEDSCIGINCHVPNRIKIGNNVMMGPNCYFLSYLNHRYDRVDIPVGAQGVYYIEKTTEIGDDVWFGRQCLILAGRKIGSHTVIGAGSVVSKDVPDYVLAAGNPIRIIKERK